MPENTPGGQEEYRVVLGLSFFYRFFLDIAKQRGVKEIVGLPEWKRLESAVVPLPIHMPTSSKQTIPQPVYIFYISVSFFSGLTLFIYLFLLSLEGTA